MNSNSRDNFLDRVELALTGFHGGRRESEISFLQQLLSDLGGSVFPFAMTPARLFRAAVNDLPVMQSANGRLRVIALPSKRPEDVLQAGDWMIRVVPGTGDVGHVSVLASNDLLTPSVLVSEGIAAESTQPGFYGLVIEGGAFYHSRREPFARRLLNSRGVVPPNTVFLRPEYQRIETPEPVEDLSYEEILKSVRQELNLPFTDPNDPGLLERRRRLRVLFTSVPQARTKELHARLGAKPTGDALSRLFHGRLATATRRELLKILADRFPADPMPPTTTPCQREFMGQLLPWERSLLALIHGKSEADFKGVGVIIGPFFTPGSIPFPLDKIVIIALQHNNAITIDNNIFFPRAIDTSIWFQRASDTSTICDLSWLIHESVHVVDYHVAGVEAFLTTYMQQAIVHGFKHDDIPHEQRANRIEKAAERMLARFPDLVAAIGSCDSSTILGLLQSKKAELLTALNESMSEE
jgi:hypothetical protein